MAEAGRTEEQIKELEQKVERLSEENQRLKQQLHALRHTVFGSRTEKGILLSSVMRLQRITGRQAGISGLMPGASTMLRLPRCM